MPVVNYHITILVTVSQLQSLFQMLYLLIGRYAHVRIFGTFLHTHKKYRIVYTLNKQHIRDHHTLISLVRYSQKQIQLKK